MYIYIYKNGVHTHLVYLNLQRMYIKRIIHAYTYIMRMCIYLCILHDPRLCMCNYRYIYVYTHTQILYTYIIYMYIHVYTVFNT